MSSSFVAGGNITPSRFVSLSTTSDRTVVQSVNGDTTIIGISQPGTHLTPLLTLDDGFAAIAGENLRVYTKGDPEAWLELGGTVAAGDLLTPDSSGRGTTASGAATFFGARALQAGVLGQIVKVQPFFGEIG